MAIEGAQLLDGADVDGAHLSGRSCISRLHRLKLVSQRFDAQRGCTASAQHCARGECRSCRSSPTNPAVPSLPPIVVLDDESSRPRRDLLPNFSRTSDSRSLITGDQRSVVPLSTRRAIHPPQEASWATVPTAGSPAKRIAAYHLVVTSRLPRVLDQPREGGSLGARCS
jgi:hypothetical protein